VPMRSPKLLALFRCSKVKQVESMEYTAVFPNKSSLDTFSKIS
jgi:hypothetical protein